MCGTSAIQLHIIKELNVHRTPFPRMLDGHRTLPIGWCVGSASGFHGGAFVAVVTEECLVRTMMQRLKRFYYIFRPFSIRNFTTVSANRPISSDELTVPRCTFAGIQKSSSCSRWSEAENQKLFTLVSTYGNAWDLIASEMPGRSIQSCKQQYYIYRECETRSVKKIPWTVEDDEKLISLYKESGPRWSLISRLLSPRRSYQACRNRFVRQLGPSLLLNDGKKPILRGRWTPLEDDRLRAAVGTHGTEDWLKIAKELWVRSAEECERRYQFLMVANDDSGIPRFTIHFAPEEINRLRKAVEEKSVSWDELARQFPGRSSRSLLLRYEYGWPSQSLTPEDKKQLCDLVAIHGRKWLLISKLMGKRFSSYRLGKEFDGVHRRKRPVTARQKSEQIVSRFTAEEDKILLSLLYVFGRRWTHIANALRRPTISVCSRYRSLVKAGRATLSDAEKEEAARLYSADFSLA